MTDERFASWLLPEVAAEHDAMNRAYFEKGTVGTYPYFYKLRDAMTLVLQAGQVPLSCLDIGCGAGWQARYLDQCDLLSRVEYEGLDISPHMCERACANYPKGKFHVNDVLGFSPQRTWDITMACGSIEHFADWKAFLSKMAELSSKWIIVHKLFFTLDNAPTWVLERRMYQGLKEIRVMMNFDECQGFLDSLGFAVASRYDWDNGNVSGLVARRK